MSADENKALMRRFYEEVFNKKNLGAIGDFLDPHIVEHALPPSLPAGIEGSKQFIGQYLAAFPDLRITAEDLVAEGDRVVARFTVRGTHRGDFMGIPPTGKQVTMSGIQIGRIVADRMAENWMNLDMLGVLQQLGVVPSPQHASA